MTDHECQRWDLTIRGVHHRVEVTGSFSRTARWFVDDQLITEQTSSDDTVRLHPTEPAADDPVGDGVAGDGAAVAAGDERGAVVVKFTALGRAKRVTWYGGQGDMGPRAQALVGTGGIDLDPEPGSPAALRDERIRLHPRRYAAYAVAGGVAKVVVPLLLGLLVVRLTVSIPWPNWSLPSIPWPAVELPSIPWPDLPSLPWPDISLPDWQLPEWMRWVLDKVKYVWPVVLAWALARGEINRRRKQDALKAQLRADALAQSSAGDQGRSASAPPTTTPEPDQARDDGPASSRP